jgi:hypothetical protein
MLWAGFIVFVCSMLTIDLGVFHRKAHEVSLKEAGMWSAVWVALAIAFNVGVYVWFLASMGIIAGVLALSIVASLLKVSGASLTTRVEGAS